MESASNGIDLSVRNLTDLENSCKEELSHETIIVGDGVAGDFDCTTYRAPWVSLHRITLVEADKTTLTSRI